MFLEAWGYFYSGGSPHNTEDFEFWQVPREKLHSRSAAGPAVKSPVCLALTKGLRPLEGAFTSDAKFRGGAQAVSDSSVLSSWLGLPYLPAGCRGSTSASTDILLPSPSFTLHPSCWGQGLSLLLEGTTWKLPRQFYFQICPLTLFCLHSRNLPDSILSFGGQLSKDFFIRSDAAMV